LASIVKVVKALEKGLIPPAANLETINPKLKLGEWNLKVSIFTSITLEFTNTYWLTFRFLVQLSLGRSIIPSGVPLLTTLDTGKFPRY